MAYIKEQIKDTLIHLFHSWYPFQYLKSGYTPIAHSDPLPELYVCQIYNLYTRYKMNLSAIFQHNHLQQPPWALTTCMYMYMQSGNYVALHF